MLSASGEPAARVAPIAGDEQDLVFLHDARPYLFRLHLQSDGHPAQSVWNDYMDSLFAYLDSDGNGVLSPQELARAPSVEQFVQQLLGAHIDPAPAPDFAAVDVNADGKITKEELKLYYRRHGAGPMHVATGQRQGPADPLSDALFKHLDTNKDGKLSFAELDAAFATLSKLDANDDEMITLDELTPTGFGEYVFRPVSRARTDLRPLPFLLIHPGEPLEPLARQLIAHYDRDQDGRLNCAEAGFDAASFNRLDGNRDGQLDVAEIVAWLRQAPDVELAIQLGEQPAHESVTDLTCAESRTSYRAPRHNRSHTGVVAEFRDTRIDFHRDAHVRATLENRKQSYLARFKAADANGDGFLDRKEVYRPPFEFVALLRLADRDGDGRLSMKELEAFAELQAKATSCFTILTIADRGKSLFELLDVDRDGRLGQRELRTARARLAVWDQNDDGFLTRAELPRQFLVTVSHGHPDFTDRTAGAPGYGPASRSTLPKRGPLWFRHMDRNGDGDVSQREFLGTPEDFKRLDADGDGLISVEEAERADRELKNKQ
jgi:Ca2+-binding EF-hand superfamily protein